MGQKVFSWEIPSVWDRAFPIAQLCAAYEAGSCDADALVPGATDFVRDVFPLFHELEWMCGQAKDTGNKLFQEGLGDPGCQIGHVLKALFFLSTFAEHLAFNIEWG